MAGGAGAARGRFGSGPSFAGATLTGPPAWWVALAMALAVVLQYGGALHQAFLGDDYAVLDKVGNAPLSVVWSRGHLFSYWYRPWSRELHYWVLARVFGAREPAWHVVSFALWIAVMVLFYALARRLAGGRAAALACAGLAALAAWSGALVWVAGVQELWLLLWAMVFLHGFARRWTLPALAALGLALLSKETAAVLVGVAFVWALAIDRQRAAIALGRIVPFAALAGAWAAIHPWLLRRFQGPLPGNTEQASHLGPLAVAARFALSLVNLDERPAPEGGIMHALLGGLAGILVLGLFAAIALAPRASRRRGDVESLPGARTLGLGWALCGALPLLVPSIGWHAYYGLFAAFGAWLVIASVLARVPALAVAVVLAVAALRPLRAATPSWDWSSTAYQARASTYLGALRDSLRARHPTLAPRTRLFVTQVPEGIRLVSADGAALRVWYGDPTLRAAYLSQYQPRGAADSTGRDLFFRFDTTGAWIEIVHGDEDVAAARLADPAWEEDHRELALALGRGGDWAGAAAEVAKLVAAFPDRFDYALNLARCYEGMGDEILARKWYAKAAATPGASPAAKAAPLAYEARLRERRAQP